MTQQSPNENISVKEDKDVQDIKRRVENALASGNHAFVGYAWWGLKVYDISNLSSPKVTFTEDLSEEVEAVFISKDYLFLNKKEKRIIYDNLLNLNLKFQKINKNGELK